MNKQFKVKKHLGREETDGIGFLDNFGLSDTEHTPTPNQRILFSFVLFDFVASVVQKT